MKVDKFIFPTDFIVLDMEDEEIPIILGRLFLATGKTVIDVHNSQLILRVQDEEVTFNVLKVLKHPNDGDNCSMIDVVDGYVKKVFQATSSSEPLKTCITGIANDEISEIIECINHLEATSPNFIKRPLEEFGTSKRQPVSSTEKPPELKLKPLSTQLSTDCRFKANSKKRKAYIDDIETILTKLKSRFPTLLQDVLRKVYRYRLERLMILMRLGLPEHIRWIIEAKVRLVDEINDSFIKRLPSLRRISYSKKKKAKRMEVCHKCARWTCNTHCQSLGYLSLNREEKIKYIKDGLSKESLDNIHETLETHPCGMVQRVLLYL